MYSAALKSLTLLQSDAMSEKWMPFLVPPKAHFYHPQLPPKELRSFDEH